MSNEETEKHWMEKEYGVPHKNGHVRFYMVGYDEDVWGYLGWFDMTDWDEGWKKVWETAEKSRNGDDAFQVLRHDQMLDLIRNVQWALEEALEDKDETTFSYWWKQERLKEDKLKEELK
jgi:hypothetical protein